MIYTVTLNPSLDYFAAASSFVEGATNRTAGERILPGGKGLNVSMMLSRLGRENTAIAIAAGFTGRELARLLAKEKVPVELLRAKDGFTRINVKLTTGVVTEFNGAGITVDEALIRQLKRRLSLMTPEDVLVLSGSLPKGAKPGLYRELIEASPARVVLDACGDALLSALPAHPFLIKPNAEELAALFGTPAASEAERREQMASLQERGAGHVLVSLGGEGAALLTPEGEFFSCPAPAVPPGLPLQTVAAGDSLIAGFLHRFLSAGDCGEALRYGVCAGTAAAYSPWLPEAAFIEELYAFSLDSLSRMCYSSYRANEGS